MTSTMSKTRTSAICFLVPWVGLETRMASNGWMDGWMDGPLGDPRQNGVRVRVLGGLFVLYLSDSSLLPCPVASLIV